jgi:hypothetical protein
MQRRHRGGLLSSAAASPPNMGSITPCFLLLLLAARLVLGAAASEEEHACRLHTSHVLKSDPAAPGAVYSSVRVRQALDIRDLSVSVSLQHPDAGRLLVSEGLVAALPSSLLGPPAAGCASHATPAPADHAERRQVHRGVHLRDAQAGRHRGRRQRARQRHLLRRGCASAPAGEPRLPAAAAVAPRVASVAAAGGASDWMLPAAGRRAPQAPATSAGWWRCQRTGWPTWSTALASQPALEGARGCGC